jgi:hypothetical protein
LQYEMAVCLTASETRTWSHPRSCRDLKERERERERESTYIGWEHHRFPEFCSLFLSHVTSNSQTASLLVHFDNLTASFLHTSTNPVILTKWNQQDLASPSFDSAVPESH